MKEYTYIEFDEKIKKENLEIFTKSQIDTFCKDFLKRKDEMNEFEKSYAEADFNSLTPCIVVNEDLTKSIFYYRECQKEPVEIPEGIFKSIDDSMCFKFKETPLNIFKGIAGINCADKDAIEKAKALPIGTEKTYGGKLYIKTSKGWRLKPKGTKGSNKVEEKEDVKSTLDKFEEQYKKNSSAKPTVSAEELKKLSDEDFDKKYNETKKLYNEMMSNKNINDITRESANKTMEVLEKEKKDRENKINNIASELKKELDRKIKDSENEIAKIFNKIDGIDFKKNFYGETKATIGEYDYHTGGSASYLSLRWDSGLARYIDHTQTQYVKKVHEGSMILGIQGGYDFHKIDLSDKNKNQLKKIIELVSEINNVKRKDLISITGFSEKEKLTKKVNSIIYKYKTYL